MRNYYLWIKEWIEYCVRVLLTASLLIFFSVVPAKMLFVLQENDQFIFVVDLFKTAVAQTQIHKQFIIFYLSY